MQDAEAAQDDAVSARATDLPWPGDAPLFASGTDALAALLRWGAEHRGWSRVWLPSYYCPEVPAALRAFPAGVEVLVYPDHELWAAPEPRGVPAVEGDVVVVANQLGVRRRPAAGRPARRGAPVVEDHSHDLGSDWARNSVADFAFASLRKTLPIPDGGVVWSPRGHELPPEPGTPGGGPAAQRLASAIERRHRAGGPVAGERLRLRALARIAAAATGEPTAAAAPSPPGSPERPGISPVSRALVAQMPLQAWRERRRANIEGLAEAVGTPAHARILPTPEGGVAFALTLVFDTAQARARAQEALRARAVVPTVLWPLDPALDTGTSDADADLSRRILSIHADQRFDASDMLVLGAILQEALRSA